MLPTAMTEIRAGTVDVYVIRKAEPEWRVLVLQRASTTRCPHSWETVHGRIEEGEHPDDAAVRELREETGLAPSALYSITVNPFYLARRRTVELAIVFAAFVAEPGEVALGEEHQRSEWLRVEEAAKRFTWPREKAALRDIVALLGGGDAGAVEDVLRVR